MVTITEKAQEYMQSVSNGAYILLELRVVDVLVLSMFGDYLQMTVLNT